MTIRVRAPATTANVGSGFDCAGIALDLWNELEVVEGDFPLADRHHLGIAAFNRLAPLQNMRFDFIYGIPRSSGLGSSASLIALGLVAGALAAEIDLDPERLLAAGLPLEGHPDNLAPALVGGACLTFDGHIRRVADDVPAVPILVRPRGEETSTSAARAALPISVPHEDAAFSVGRATLLGAAIASGSEELFSAALDDRLHEPYRSGFLADVRGALPDGALGATLSGSGPTVVVWTRDEAVPRAADELAELWPAAEVAVTRVSSSGAIP